MNQDGINFNVINDNAPAANDIQDQIRVDSLRLIDPSNEANRMNPNSGLQVDQHISVESTVANPIQNVIDSHENSSRDLNANSNVNLNIRENANPFNLNANPLDLLALQLKLINCYWATRMLP